MGLVVLGPGLRPGSLLSLDLLVTPHIPVPTGLYGLGPALSQRVPSFAVLGLASRVVGGPLATKVAIVAMVAAAFAGAARLVGPQARVTTRLAAGVLWAAGPFALTRIGVGHLNVLWGLAVLPWALPRLCRPSASLPSTFLAAGLLAFGGPGSGTLGVAVAGIALLVERDRRPVRVLLAVGSANLAWILPTAVLLWAGAAVNGAGGFATDPGGPAGWIGLVVGNGFWRADEQVGARGLAGALAGAVLVGLALVGRRRLDRSWGATASIVAAVGLGLAVASAIPGVRSAYGWLTDLPIGAPLRESQRFLALWLVVAVPAAALGGEELARRIARHARAAALVAVVPLALALAVSVPGWWGIGGRLDPVHFPSGWAAARARIHRQPGTVVAFPWNEYPQLSFAEGRQAFNPIPDYLGGDVISSYDPNFHPDVPSQEQVDRRAVVVDRLSRQVRGGRRIGAGLADLGVRWVLLAHERGWEGYGALRGDPGLRLVQHGPTADLYAVRAWAGPATAPDGSSHRVGRPFPPVLTTRAPKGSVLDVAGAPGWVQGWSDPVAETADGRLRLTGTGTIVWFWPAAALIVADVFLMSAVIWSMGRRHHSGGPR